jgi:hypothetical protein
MKVFLHLWIARLGAAIFTAALLMAGCEQASGPEPEGRAAVSGDVRADIDIATEDDLFYFAEFVLTEPGATGVLLNDITLTRPWTPIGQNPANPVGLPLSYAGTFSGNGHTISGLDVNSGASYVGFFALNNGLIHDLTLAGTVTATATAALDYVGGVAGYNDIDGVIQKVISQVTVNAASDSIYNIGGIAGFNGWDEYNSDSPHFKQTYEEGGIIIQCRNEGPVTGGFNKIGGIAGENAWQITECVNTGTITCAKTRTGWPGVGGIAGRNGNNNDATEKGRILDCYNRGTVVDKTTQSTSQDAYGGITGWCNILSVVTNCYTTGDLTPAVGKKNPIIGTADDTTGLGINNYSLEGIFASSKDIVLTGTISSQAYMQDPAFVKALNGGDERPYVYVANDYPKLDWEK